MKTLARLFITAMAPLLIGAATASEVELTDADLENLVKRSYQYVAMYNVNNKIALKQGGWNSMEADTDLKDHTMQDIARPYNDTLYITAIINNTNSQEP